MKLFSQTLYKNKQIWICEVEDFNNYSVIKVTFGQNGGKLQTKETVISAGKNIGKANQTTHQTQAVLEAQSKVSKQRDKLYTETENAVIFRVIPRPMLAQGYDKHAHKIKFPCYVQPKLDGIRCLSLDPDRSIGPCNRKFQPIFISRQGKQFKTLQHLENETAQLLTELSSLTKINVKHGICLDGELYTDDLNFQQIVSAIKRDEPNALTDKIQYHIYDLAISKIRYKERMDLLTAAFIKVKPTMLVNVPTYEIDRLESIDSFHSYYVDMGKEGVILRNSNGLYQHDKRSYDLQKVKSFDDGEFEIVGYKIDKNDQVVFECVTDNGDTFEVKPMGDKDTRDMYTDDAEDLVGEYMTVKYFGMTTGDNPVPRFPVGVSIRNFEY